MHTHTQCVCVCMHVYSRITHIYYEHVYFVDTFMVAAEYGLIVLNRLLTLVSRSVAQFLDTESVKITLTNLSIITCNSLKNSIMDEDILFLHLHYAVKFVHPF